MSGLSGEEARSVTRSASPTLERKLSINLVGNPAMGLREYREGPQESHRGNEPDGDDANRRQYDGTKLINLGTNRWGFKPEVGVAVPKGRWDIDAYLGVWLFTDNDDFYPGGRTRSQDHVVALQGHAS